MKLGDIDFRNNAIGFLRIFFAAVVVWSHSYLGGFPRDPISRLTGDEQNAGFLAVAGFFVLSGFLITRSYETSPSTLRFLWHRFLRIFPAFWVCLVFVAFVIAPLVWLRERGTLDGFLSGANPPWGYVISNALLTVNQYNIRELLQHTSFPLVFNGSLWTLPWEFVCYLSIAALGIAAVLKRVPMAIAAFFIVWSAVTAFVLWNRLFTPAEMSWGAIQVVAYFAAGSCAYLFRDRIPIRTWIAVVCAALLVATFPTRVWALFVVPCAAYLTLFAAAKLPIRGFDRRADLSYGLYIYAYPVEQLLAVYGLNRWGVTPYLLGVFVVSLSLAAASWFAIEWPCLSLKNYGLPFYRRRVANRAEQG